MYVWMMDGCMHVYQSIVAGDSDYIVITHYELTHWTHETVVTSEGQSWANTKHRCFYH